MPSKPTRAIKPTEDDLRLLKYFGLTEFDDISVARGDQGSYDIEILTENRELLEIIEIPFGEAEREIMPIDGYYCSYPRISSGSKTRRCIEERKLEERNLRGVLLDLAVHLKAIEDAKLLAVKAEEEAALRIRLEYGELDISNDRTA